MKKILRLIIDYVQYRPDITRDFMSHVLKYRPRK